MTLQSTLQPTPARLPLARWDREVAPYLRGIEACGKALTRASSDLGRILPMLRMRPAFLSLAEDALAEAESNLGAALAAVRRARADFAARPADGA